MMRQDFWSRFHRRFGFGYDPFGLSFNYKGDEIIWLLPKHRTDKKLKFFSIGFGCGFKSLKEIDNLWEEYFNECKDLPQI